MLKNIHINIMYYVKVYIYVFLDNYVTFLNLKS
jgi:hypothetical protein